MLEYEDVIMGQPYEENPPQKSRIFYYFIEKTPSHYKMIENIRYSQQEIYVKFENVNLSDWNYRNKEGELDNLYPFLEPCIPPKECLHSVIIFVFTGEKNYATD